MGLLEENPATLCAVVRGGGVAEPTPEGFLRIPLGLVEGFHKHPNAIIETPTSSSRIPLGYRKDSVRVLWEFCKKTCGFPAVLLNYYSRIP